MFQYSVWSMILITPNKHSAIRGKNLHHKELRSSSISPFFGGGWGEVSSPVLRKLARGYRNISHITQNLEKSDQTPIIQRFHLLHKC